MSWSCDSQSWISFSEKEREKRGKEERREEKEMKGREEGKKEGRRDKGKEGKEVKDKKRKGERTFFLPDSPEKNFQGCDL